MVKWIGTPKNIEQYQGFVYCITELDTEMRYIGKKNYFKIKKLPPLKNHKNKRHFRIETDWKTYNSSNKELQVKIAKKPRNYMFKILYNCVSKTDMSVYEAYLQLEEYVNGSWGTLYNQIINLRVRLR